MIRVYIRVPGNQVSKSSPNEQVFTLWLDDKVVGKIIKAFVQLGTNASELTLDFIDQRWYSK